MKSIFTKLSVLLACGVFAMVGCTDFSEDIKGVDGKVDVTNSEVAQLKDAVEDLDKKLSEQYATKEEVEELASTISDLQDALAAAEKELQDAIDAKADKAVVEEAIKNATDAIAGLQTALDQVVTDNAALQDAVAKLTERVTAAETALAEAQEALKTAEGNIETLIADLDFALGEIKRLQSDITELQTELGNYKAEVDAELEKIRTSISDLNTKLNAEIDALKAAIADAATKDDVQNLQNQIDDINKLLESKVDQQVVKDIEAQIEAIKKQIEAINECECEGECQCDPSVFEAKIAALEQTVAELKAKVESLDGEETTPGTDNDTIYDDAALKATIAALEAKIAALEEAIKSLKDSDTIYDDTLLKDKVADLEEAVQDLKDKQQAGYDDQELRDRIEVLEGIVAGLKDNDTIYDDAEVIAKLEALEQAIKNLAGQDNSYDDTALKAELQKLADAFDAFKNSLPEDQDTKYDEEIAKLEQAIKNLVDNDTVYDDATLKAALEELQKAFENLVDKDTIYDDAELKKTVAELNKALAEATAEYKALAAGLQEQITALGDRLTSLEGAVENLAQELRGIVMVPEILVSGTPAVEFKSLAYVPMAADSDVFVDAEEAAEYEIIGSNETAAYYHFNPSNFDIKAAKYSVVSTKVETRAAAEPVATVGAVVKDGDKVKVTLLRDKGADNMFALAATLNNGVVIYSDYALVLDDQVTAKDLVIVDNNDVALYTTLAETEAATEQISLTSEDQFSFADYVKAIDPFYASFGLEYKYSLVYGDIAVEADGKADLKGGNGVSIVKVEAVYGTDVVRRAYVKIYVNYVEPVIPGIYYDAYATASVEAKRIAFEVKDIYVWAKALKDEPNTIEILKEVVCILKKIGEIQMSDDLQVQKNHLIKAEVMKAYELLNGVPGFVYKYKEFSGEGHARVKVEVLPEVMSVAELKAVLNMIEEQYPQANIVDDLAQAVEKFIPESLKTNFLVSGILNALKGFNLADILENELVVNLLEAGQAVAEKLGTSILDYDKINAFLENVIKNTVGENKYGEVAAKLAAEAKARAAAEEAMKANFNAANDQLFANFQNGTWGQIYDFLNVDLNLDNEIVASILEKLQLTEEVTMFKEVLGQITQKAEDLVKYTYETEDVVYDVTVERSVVE